VVLVALFLVNLPFVHETLTERRISRSGQDVTAMLVKAQTLNGRRFVDYRLPESVDPKQLRFSARVDGTTWAQAKETGELVVRVVPDKPSANRPVGEVPSNVFGWIAGVSDVVLLLAAVLLWRRWRRWSRHEVVAVGEGLVSLAAHGSTLTASAPQAWLARQQPGDQVSGALHLVADGDLVPGLPLSGLEQVSGSSYVVRGRVVDARSGRVELELADGFRLSVETGPHRIRADIRDSTEIRGTLCFTPTVSRG
jgi:hypothetical protein